MRDDSICKVTGIEHVSPPSYRPLDWDRPHSVLEAAHIIHFHFMAKSRSQSSASSSSHQGGRSTSGSSRKSSLRHSPARSRNPVKRVAHNQPSLAMLSLQKVQNVRANKAWKVLQLYAGNESKLNELLQHPQENVKHAINSTYNGLLLESIAHQYFDALKAYLWPHVRSHIDII
jgi:HNH endonuclease